MNIVRVDDSYRLADGDTLIGSFPTRADAQQAIEDMEGAAWDEMPGDLKRLFLMTHDSTDVARKVRGSKNPFAL